MAKSTATPALISEPIISAAADSRIEEFAEDLGHLLGAARVKADSWLAQRDAVVKHLEDVRDAASQLLQQLGLGGGTAAPAKAAPAPSAPVKRGPGRPPKAAAPAAVATPQPRKRFTMSAEARERIAAAQRARWAKVRTAASVSEAQPAVKRGGSGRPRKVQTVGVPRKRRTMSAEAREKIAAAQRARWAKQKAGKK